MGFCFGGGLAFNVAAVIEPDVLVSYYGSSFPETWSGAWALMLDPVTVSATSLYHFGLRDQLLGRRRWSGSGTALAGRPDVVFETYEGADHAFDNADFPLHNAEASALAWKRTVAFLDTHLPPG